MASKSRGCVPNSRPRTAHKAGLGLERLEERRLLSGIVVQGAGPGAPPVVQVLDSDTGAEVLHFSAYGPAMRSGVRVAVGDVNGDGALDIVTATGPGASPVVKVFRSTDGGLISSFALPAGMARGGVWLAVGDVNGDGRADIIVSPGAGTPRVRVYDGADGHLEESFLANAVGGPRAWMGGAKVAVGDVNNDGFADIAATPASGQAVVAVFDGRTEASTPIAGFRAFAGRANGRTSIAVADLNGDRQLGVVVAEPRRSTADVKVFSAATGGLVGHFAVADAASASGVQIAAINLGGRGSDELAVSPPGGRRASTAVVSVTSGTLSMVGMTPSVVRRPSTSARGAFLAGDSSVAVSTPAVAVGSIEPPLSQALPVLQRLAYFDPTTQTFVPLQPDDPRLAGKDITVITHGWAPGYVDWVNHEATVNDHVLMWWQTFPGQPGYDAAWVAAHPDQGPDSVFLLNGVTDDSIFGDTEISPVGLAQSILSRTLLGTPGPADSNAAVVAYSWIDDSATPTWDFLHVSVPEESYKSEALTTLNGERLAAGLEQALGTSFTGKIQLVGHSHGSKVVSVAGLALQQAGLPIEQITTLDSPEDDVTVAGDAANYNWFFLKQLTGVDRATATGPFLENEISEFDVPYSGITLSDGTGATLTQVVDVNLVPDIYLTADVGDRHSYSAAWYAGSGEPSVTSGQTVGQYWSPLLPANAGPSNPVPTLPSYSNQNWGFFSQPASQQYVLNPDPPAPTETITFAPLDTPTVSLTQDGTITSSSPVSVEAPYYGQSGISFDYQFPTSQPGDRLVILAGGKPAFVMDAALVGSGVNHATISLSALPFESHSLTFVLTSTTSNTTSRVSVSNFRTFDQPLT